MENRFNNKGEDFTIGSININGISNRNHLLLDRYVDNSKFKLFAVQESLTCDKDKIKLSNMKIITDTNKSTNRGAVLYIHNSIPSTNLVDISRISKHIDSAWALIVIKDKRYIVGSIYVNDRYPQAMSDALCMLNSANEMKGRLKATGIILMGDFNARHTLWGDRLIDKHGKELVENLNYSQFSITTAQTPTFMCDGGSSFIDLIIASNNVIDQLKPCTTDNTTELFSGAPRRGHVPLLTSLMGSRLSPTKVTEKLDIQSINWEEWSAELENLIRENLENISRTEDPEKLWEIAEKAIEETNSKHAKMKRSSRHSRPYWNDELTALCKKMKETRKFYMYRNTDRNKNQMIQAKEDFDNERKKACQDFIIESTKSLNAADSAEFWKKFNAMFKKHSDQGVDPLYDDKLGVITDNPEIEEKLFNTFFQSEHFREADLDENFFEEIRQEYEEIQSQNRTEHYKHGENNPKHNLNTPISLKEIKAAIKHTKASNKGLDNHNMHPKMLHNFGDNALNLLKKLFNKCLNQGHWVWDKAKVIFLKKDGKDSYAQPGSYRPISISSYVGKLLEKILAKRIAQYLASIGVYDPNQEGFTTKRNTMRYLNRLNLQIKYELSDGNTVVGLFIDFEKAFDSIWKEGLIVKMSRLKMNGKMLTLIEDFLKNRKVTLDVNGYAGEVRNTGTYGLPQGSALSPVLFKIYLLDILEEYNNTEGISVFKFADDGSVVISKRTSEECIESLNQIMQSLKTWSSKWRMVINCQKNKTEYIKFGAAVKDTDTIPETMKLGDKDIRRVKETKVLGLLVDEKLSYSSHCQVVLNRLLGKWAMVCKYSNNQWGFKLNVIRQITTSLILSILHYAGLVWLTNINIAEVESLWYKIVKASTGAVFNVRKSIAEVIIGIPPIKIQNIVNKVKHYLKLNINPAPQDKVRDLIAKCYRNQEEKVIPVELKSCLKETFKFLTWKCEVYPNHFTANDKYIVSKNITTEFLNLTTKSCSYTQNQIIKYTEKIWNHSIRNELNMDGFYHVPKTSCSKLPVPPRVSRHDEVVLMSCMYTNNLFNSFLYSHTYSVESPLCRKCKSQEETPYHILLQCSEKSQEARQILLQVLSEEELLMEDSTTILNGSRHQPFLKICLNILSENNYDVQVNLKSEDESALE